MGWINRTWIVFLVLNCLRHKAAALPDVIQIGGLFDTGDIKQKTAFEYAVRSANSDRQLFGSSSSRLHTLIEEIPKFDSFRASKIVCQFLKSNLGIAAVFGPQSGQTSAHVQSICDAMEIPHIETRWDYRLRRDDYSVNLYPHPSSLSKAYLDLVRLFGWKSFCILYENNVGLVRLQELLKTTSPTEFKISIRQLSTTNDHRAILESVKSDGQNNIILDCSTRMIHTVLKQAQQIGMVTPYNNYIITSLDLHLVDLEDFKFSGTNVTSVRLFDPEDEEVMFVMKNIKKDASRHRHNPAYDEGVLTGTETALMYDAVRLFVKAIKALDNTTDVRMNSLDCDGEMAWEHGFSLINYIKLVNMTGLTGNVRFDTLGFRTNFDLDIVELTLSGLKEVGSWSLIHGANYTREDFQNETKEGLRNRTLRVAFAFNDPYIMRKEKPERLYGNDRYEGFCIDLLNEIAKHLSFNFTLIPSPDNKYGSKTEDKGWNGMMKMLIDQEVDMAITDFTITHEREEAVDFTMPFMNLGISILYKKPQKSAPSLFSFLSPLSLGVWMYMMSAYAGVSILMYILARFTPYEWANPHPCNPEPDTLENQFTILNCLWFAIGSLMQQGCDFLPQAMSTRMVAGMWWFFTLIMISSYTANLAAFLTVERMESPIESAEDLAKQTKIKYGCMRSGSTLAFFKNSPIPHYKTMYEFMESQTPSVYVRSNQQGFDQVENWEHGEYAYLSESTSIQYITERRCQLTQIGGLLDSKSYGIALPQGATYKSQLDEAILSLQERARLYILKDKWWKQQRGGGRCTEKDGGSALASELNLDNVGGVFVVLMGGMGLALLVAICEFVNECCRVAKEDKIPFMQVLQEELRFVFKCRGSVKPVKRKPAELDESNSMYDSNNYKYSDRNALT